VEYWPDWNAGWSMTRRWKSIVVRTPGPLISNSASARRIRAMARARSGAQTISDKQAELLKNALGELSAAVKVRSSSDSTGEKIADITKQEAELVQSTLQRTLEGMKEMAEAVQTSQTQIYEIALGRAKENAEQLRSLFLRDNKGIPRLRICIGKENQPLIQTLDDQGRVVGTASFRAPAQKKAPTDKSGAF